MDYSTAMDMASEISTRLDLIEERIKTLSAVLVKIEDRLADLGTRLDSLTATASLVALASLSHDHPDMRLECMSMLSKACRDALK